MGGRIGYGKFGSLLLLTSALSGIPSLAALGGDLTVSNARTTPADTATGDGTGPGAISIAAAGTIVVPTGTAVTINTSNAFTSLGAISSNAPADGTGLLVDLGATTANSLTSNIVNGGAITVPGIDLNASNVATSTNNVAVRFSGLGTFTGSFINEVGGVINVGSYGAIGVAVNSNYIGGIDNEGVISAVGTNAVGLSTTAKITGDVIAGGTIAASGANGIGVYIGGGIDGRFTQTGSIVSGLGPQLTQNANGTISQSAALPGYAGLWISSDVTGGVLLYGNKITSAAEALLTTAPTILDSTITMIGNGPALLVSQGGANTAPRNILLGPQADEEGYGLAIESNITAAGTTAGVTSNAINIEGMKVGNTIYTTTLTKGLLNDGGSLSATAIDASATLLHIGNYAVVPTIDNRGDLLVTTGDSTTSPITGVPGTKGGDGYGIVIEQFANVQTINNSGNITVVTDGVNPSAYGIIDRSGTVTTFVNTGTITASAYPFSAAKSIALDFSANTAGMSFTNNKTITGNVLLGGGNTTVAMTNGTLTGDLTFQAGASKTGNNAISLDKGVITGKVALGSGTNTVTLNNSSSINGGLSGTGATALTVNQSSVTVNSGASLALSTGSFSTGSVLNFNLSNVAPAAPVIQASGNVSFAAGSSLTASFSGILTSDQTYTLVQAGSLTFGSSLSAITTAPTSFLSTATVRLSPTNSNVIQMVVHPKTAAELHLGPNGAALYSVFATALNQDSPVATALSAQTTEAGVKTALQQLSPDTSGATMQVALNGQDMSAGQIRRRLVGVAKNGSPDHALGDVASFWAQAIGDYDNQNASGEQAGFSIWGLGIAVGTDMSVADHTNVGLSLVETWHSASLEIAPNSPVQFYSTQAYLYGRTDIGSLYVQAIGGGGINNYNQNRHVNFGGLNRASAGVWNGYQYGATVESGLGINLDKYRLTPFVRGSYLQLHENAYAEQSGGKGIDLSIGAKDPKSTRGSTGFTLDRNFAGYYDSYVEAEFRANYTREFTSGAPVVTSSFISGGSPFVNAGAPRTPNRYTVGFGIAHKDSYSSVSIDYDAEFASGYLAHTAGVTARFRF